MFCSSLFCNVFEIRKVVVVELCDCNVTEPLKIKNIAWWTCSLRFPSLLEIINYPQTETLGAHNYAFYSAQISRTT